ncbi:MAG: FAD-dependent oxidoreductase, partial [Gammaproteobacteria bacterium]|nr:FAD-dependent oxidoreductase [Gammaproteobacteria bacterium]
QDIHYTYAGVRPLPRHDKGPESAITRKHIILKHRKQARGLISIIGGKLTTYRSLAEIAVDKAVREIGGEFAECQTRDQPLPGRIDLESTTKIIVAYPGISTRCVARLQSVYGSRAARIVELSAEHPGFVDDSQTVLVAEVIYAMRNEFAVTLTDIVHRRLMTGLLPDLGRSMITAIADVAAAEAGWDEPTRQAQLDRLRDHEMQLRANVQPTQ